MQVQMNRGLDLSLKTMWCDGSRTKTAQIGKKNKIVLPKSGGDFFRGELYQ
jgi:hypothetical protein